MSALVEDKIGLRLPGPRPTTRCSGCSPRKLPDDIPEGRGFRSETAHRAAVRPARPRTSSGQAQAAALRRIGEEAAARYADVPASLRPFRVDVLPARIGFDEAWELRDPQLARRCGRWSASAATS